MQEKKDQPGQGDMGGEKKPYPGEETGKQGGDIGKKGGTGDVGREGDKSGQQPSPEKKY
jgi:hypothetical protein